MRKTIHSLLRRGWNWTRSQDLIVLVLLFILVAGTWSFIELADEVTEGETREIDRAILRALRSPNDPADPLGPRRIEEGIRDYTALGSVAVLGLVSAIVAGFLLLARKYAAFILLVCALGGGLGLNWTLKRYFARERPDFVSHLHYVDSYSFPSGHALLSAVVYLTLGALVARLVTHRRQKIYVLAVAALFAFIVGFSRVYLGVHYPTDVLAGWTVGLLWAILCWLVARYLQRRGTVERPGPPPENR